MLDLLIAIVGLHQRHGRLEVGAWREDRADPVVAHAIRDVDALPASRVSIRRTRTSPRRRLEYAARCCGSDRRSTHRNGSFPRASVSILSSVRPTYRSKAMVVF